MKNNKIKHRIPMETVELLRHKGGAQTTKKGAKGYDRNKEKQNIRRKKWLG
jgi:hypothetical protein